MRGINPSATKGRWWHWATALPSNQSRVPIQVGFNPDSPALSQRETGVWTFGRRFETSFYSHEECWGGSLSLWEWPCNLCGPGEGSARSRHGSCLNPHPALSQRERDLFLFPASGNGVPHVRTIGAETHVSAKMASVGAFIQSVLPADVPSFQEGNRGRLIPVS